MSEVVTKIIGNSKLNSTPEKPLSLQIKDKAVKSTHLADDVASTYIPTAVEPIIAPINEAIANIQVGPAAAAVEVYSDDSGIVSEVVTDLTTGVKYGILDVELPYLYAGNILEIADDNNGSTQDAVILDSSKKVIASSFGKLHKVASYRIPIKGGTYYVGRVVASDETTYVPNSNINIYDTVESLTGKVDYLMSQIDNS